MGKEWIESEDFQNDGWDWDHVIIIPCSITSR